MEPAQKRCVCLCVREKANSLCCSMLALMRPSLWVCLLIPCFLIDTGLKRKVFFLTSCILYWFHVALKSTDCVKNSFWLKWGDTDWSMVHAHDACQHVWPIRWWAALRCSFVNMVMLIAPLARGLWQMKEKCGMKMKNPWLKTTAHFHINKIYYVYFKLLLWVQVTLEGIFINLLW